MHLIIIKVEVNKLSKCLLVTVAPFIIVHNNHNVIYLLPTKKFLAFL